MSRIASILLPMPLPEAFDYSEPEGMDLHVGDQVAAPLGSRLVHGVVTALRDAGGGNRPLKPVEGRIDAPPLPPNAIEFVQWAARYAVSDPGQPLAMALRAPGRQGQAGQGHRSDRTGARRTHRRPDTGAGGGRRSLSKRR